MNRFPPGTLIANTGDSNRVWIIINKEQLVTLVNNRKEVHQFITMSNTGEYGHIDGDTEIEYKDVAKRHGHLKILDSMPEFWFIAPEGAE